ASSSRLLNAPPPTRPTLFPYTTLFRSLHRRINQFNPRPRARRNVAHHYDLDGQLYTLFLDADRQYSCAYFETAEQSLDDAQLARSEEHTSELQSRGHLVCRLLLEKKNN